ncbi:MAG: hypothetical protein HZC28_16590 [Spirochaetes bacterium]|nr:hypothetical protein [Spirochaetota bacterium]
MLKEIKNVTPTGSGRVRQWYTDEYFDVYIWYDDRVEKIIYGFQLCYDTYGDEQSLTWKKDSGFTHSVIDNGDESYSMSKAQIMIPDGIFPYRKVIDEFLNRIDINDRVNKDVLIFVYDKMLEYVNALEKA